MKRYIVALIGVIIAGTIFLLYTQPTYDKVRAIQLEIAQYNQALDKANELQRLKQTLLSRYNAFSPLDLERLHKLLPDHVDNVRLILDIDNLASRFGLSLENVVVSNPVEKTTSTAGGIISAGSQAYESLTFKFTTRGTYDNFVLFMEELERSLRVVDLVTLALTPDGFSPPPGGPPQSGKGKRSGPSLPPPTPIYRYEITIRTYWLK